MGQALSRDYWRFWTASTVSNLGDGLRLVALPLLAVTLTRDPLLVSGVTALTFVPWLVLGPVSGAIVDRVDRRRLLIGVQLARGAVATVFAITVVTGTVTIAMLYVTALAIAIGETLADSAAQAAVPRLVPRDRLETANGRLVSAQMVTNDLAGAPLGAALFAFAAAAPFLVDAATYLVAAAAVWAVRTDLSVHDAPAADTHRRALRHDVLEGLRYVWSQPLLRAIALAAGLANFGAAAVGAIFVLFALDTLGVTPFGFGLLLSAGAVGGLAGALFADRVVGRRHRRRVLLTSKAISAATTAGIGLARSPAFAAAMLLATAAAVAVFNVVAQSLRQAVSPARLLGRVITGVRMVGLGAAPLGALAGGAVARTAGLRTPILLAAASVTAAWLVLVPTLTRERIDAAVAANADLVER